jgi:hypothetical protein
VILLGRDFHEDRMVTGYGTANEIYEIFIELCYMEHLVDPVWHVILTTPATWRNLISVRNIAWMGSLLDEGHNQKKRIHRWRRPDSNQHHRKPPIHEPHFLCQSKLL